MKLGLLHPGQMGVSVGAALLQNQHQVLWLTAERSAATSKRAQQAGFTSVASLLELVERSDALISVCPPAAAAEVAEQVAGLGFSGVYVDANAVAPQTATALGAAFAERYVDGGIIGPPALQPGTTRLYLAGPRAGEVAGWFAQGALQAIAMQAPVGAASALKMGYAGYTKGLSALLLATQALAQQYDVADWLESEWQQSLPGTTDRLDRAALNSAPKAWRFAGEMREIAATYAAAELPSGFHLGAAELYERLVSLKDQSNLSTAQVVATLLEKSPKNSSHESSGAEQSSRQDPADD